MNTMSPKPSKSEQLPVRRDALLVQHQFVEELETARVQLALLEHGLIAVDAIDRVDRVNDE